jgi:hypothetical protein
MSKTTDNLIRQLAADATPVIRLRPPLARAGLWLGAVAALAAAITAGFGDVADTAQRLQDPRHAVELLATLATGFAGVIAAFHLSLPDRSKAWAWLPLPFLVLWITTSGYTCYDRWITIGPEGWAPDTSADCLAFILAASVPMGLSLQFFLRRARPLAPGPVAAVGGLGVAGLAAFIVQFFHPFDVTFLDLAVHLIAVGLVVTVSTIAGPEPRRAAG